MAIFKPRFSWVEPVEARRLYCHSLTQRLSIGNRVGLSVVFSVIFGFVAWAQYLDLGWEIGTVVFLILPAAFAGSLLMPLARWRLPLRIRVYNNKVQRHHYAKEAVFFRATDRFFIDESGECPHLVMVLKHGGNALFGIAKDVDTQQLSHFLRHQGLVELKG